METSEQESIITSIKTKVSPQKDDESSTIVIVEDTSPNANEKSLQKQTENSHNVYDSHELYEIRLREARMQCDEAMEDRDRLFKMLERRSMEIERLESEQKLMKQQLQTSIDAKCVAVQKFEEVQHKIKETDFKEKCFDQERILMQNQIDMLSSDLNSNLQELQSCRKESTMKILSLEGKLHEKTEELNISTLHESQLQESNESLTTKVHDLSKSILKLNDEFAASMKKYQKELTSKSKLIDLYKEKSEDDKNEQKDIAGVVNDLKQALNEATEEYGVLETKSKEKQMQHDAEIIRYKNTVKTLQHELDNANNLLEAAKRENLEIAVEKIIPSAVSTPKLSKSGFSITKVYSMYANASENLDALRLEHEKLKQTFTQVVHEVQEKATEMLKNELELKKVRHAYETLAINNRDLKDEKLDAINEVESLMMNIGRADKKINELKQQNKDLNSQVCHLLHTIDRKPLLKRSSDDFFSRNYLTFKDIEELHQKNLKLIGLVREMSAAIEQIDANKCKDENIEDDEKSEIEVNPFVAEVSNETSKMEVSRISSQELLEKTQKLQEAEEAITSLRDKFEKHQDKKEKVIEELKSQLDQVKSEFSEISATNFKLKAEIEHKDGQLKLQQKNFDIAKRKLQSTEDKTKNSATTIAKLETSLAHLRDEFKSCSAKLSKTEISFELLTKENKNLIRLEARLRIENEIIKKQQQMQSHLMSGIESIKAMFERSENDKSSPKMAEKLAELSEKCDELERMLFNEKQNYEGFESRANAAMEELENQNQCLQEELTIANDEIESKARKIAEFAIKVLTKDEECQSDPESDPELLKIKEVVVQLRAIGKRYKTQYLELKEQIETIKTENESLKEKNETFEADNLRIHENFEKENTLIKSLLAKAKGMITKLSGENEELRNPKDESEKKGSSCENPQDSTSCLNSSANVSSVSDLNVTVQEVKSPKMSHKRQREEESEGESEGQSTKKEEKLSEKRVKIDPVEAAIAAVNQESVLIPATNQEEVSVADQESDSNLVTDQEEDSNQEEDSVPVADQEQVSVAVADQEQVSDADEESVSNPATSQEQVSIPATIPEEVSIPATEKEEVADQEDMKIECDENAVENNENEDENSTEMEVTENTVEFAEVVMVENDDQSRTDDEEEKSSSDNFSSGEEAESPEIEFDAESTDDEEYLIIEDRTNVIEIKSDEDSVDDQ